MLKRSVIKIDRDIRLICHEILNWGNCFHIFKQNGETCGFALFKHFIDVFHDSGFKTKPYVVFLFTQKYGA